MTPPGESAAARRVRLRARRLGPPPVSLRQLGAEEHVSAARIQQLLGPTGWLTPRRSQLDRQPELVTAYLNHELTRADLAKQSGLKLGAISAYLHRRGLRREADHRALAGTDRAYCYLGKHEVALAEIVGGTRRARSCKTCMRLAARVRYHQQHPTAIYQPQKGNRHPR